MSADEFRLWIVRSLTTAVLIAIVVLLWPHLHLWLYAVIGVAISLVNPYRASVRQALAESQQPKTLVQDPSKRGWS